MKATDLLKHSQYQIELSNFLIFDLKNLQKERTGGRKEKQYHILGRSLCLPQTTLRKGQGLCWVCGSGQHPARHSCKVTSLALRKGGFLKFLLSPKGYKTRGEQGSPTQLALAPTQRTESLEASRILWALSASGLEINGERLG